ncbi:TetR family transcriptional regulator [Gordonia sp. PKS22-38]|uniref:TetR family transcriptional regulator n=1 Tax=Gordonia prachuapensis TaxID=3115651 RepID=A0ABU7MRY4_9ACTN|nr:TetR family transcriptional regulator [Gordonia sp. PKS22-38]
MAAKILDAARIRFAAQGISRTTMSELAADAGISRKWLYRHFDNRDAVVRALIGRDAQRVIDSVTTLYADASDPLDAMIDALTTVVTLLRQDQLLQRLVETEPQALAPFLTTGAATLMRPAIEVTVGLLDEHFGMARTDATLAAEALIRLTLSSVLSEAATTDFDDPEKRREFFAYSVPRLIAPPHGFESG